MEIDNTPAAPGDLALVQRFVSLHDHEPGSEGSFAPSGATIRWWLVGAGLLDPDEPASDADLAWAAAVIEALRSMVFENMGGARDPAAIDLIDAATTQVGLAPRFGVEGLVPSVGGVRGAVGTILAVAFLAQLDGSWTRFKECASPTCRSVFYDRSKNRSGKWCVMAECGNRSKVRAFRQRHAGAET